MYEDEFVYYEMLKLQLIVETQQESHFYIERTCSITFMELKVGS